MEAQKKHEPKVTFPNVSLFLGILSVVYAFVPYIFPVSILFGGLAIYCGVRGIKSGKAKSIGGIVIGSSGLAVGIFVVVGYAVFGREDFLEEQKSRGWLIANAFDMYGNDWDGKWPAHYSAGILRPYIDNSYLETFSYLPPKSPFQKDTPMLTVIGTFKARGETFPVKWEPMP